MYQHYTMNQTCLPIEIDCLLPENHIVYHIDELVESISEENIRLFEPEDGRPAYHPRVMLKAILYAYAEKVYSGRDIHKMMQVNLAMHWVTGHQLPSYRTINRFRSSDTCAFFLEDLFVRFTVKLKMEKLIKLDHLFIDGTKIEANANKYSFVWKKAIDRYENLLHEKAVAYYHDEIKPEIKRQIELDGEDNLTEELLEVSQLLKEEIDQLNDAIETTPLIGRDERKQKRRRFKKYYRKLTQDFIPRKEKYTNYQATLNGRNSFSKTDPDATFMRMKDDHMMNGQLKAGYNLQIGTENQFVLAYDVFPNPTDTLTLIPFIKQLHHLPKAIIADAGYGSEENLTYLNDISLTHYIQYSSFEREQQRHYKLSPKNRTNWLYDPVAETITLPDGTLYYFDRDSRRKTSTGYQQHIRIYRPKDPDTAPQKAIYFNHYYESLKQTAREKLLSDEGQQVYTQRKIDVESVFGQIKANLRFTRCHLRGKERVKIDIGLVLMANNLRKYTKQHL